MAGKIFVSYRREDSRYAAGRVCDRLASEFGPGVLFLDVDANSIPLGSVFPKVLRQKMAECDICLAIIGAGWLNARDPSGNSRLQNENDFVRIELCAALEQGIPVIPVLLDDASMPDIDKLPEDLQGLTERQSLQVRHSSFHDDIDKLVSGLRQHLSEKKQSPPPPVAQKENKVPLISRFAARFGNYLRGGEGKAIAINAGPPSAKSALTAPMDDWHSKVKTICLVDDEKNLLISLRAALEAEGYKVRAYSDGLAALEGLTEEPADLGIFDIMMPRMDGMELLRRVRQTSDMPVIFMTSKDEEIDQLFGLKMGADDYIVKPFSLRLVVERVKAVLRRGQPKVPAPAETERTIERGNLKLDPKGHKCLWNNMPVTLTETEFLILRALAMRPGVVKTRDALMDAAYDDNVYVDDKTIDGHISRLRKKFIAVDENFDVIETLYGVGYRYKE